MYRIIYTILLAAVLTSCEKTLELDFKESAPQLVIEASLTQNGSRVCLTQSTPMDKDFINKKRYTDAMVQLTDLTVGTSVTLSPDSARAFADATPGIVGHKYLLSVERQGKHYTKKIEMAPPAQAVALNFGWMNMPGTRVALMQISVFPYTAQRYSYWIRIYRNGTHLTWATACGELVENGRIATTMIVGTDPNQDAGTVDTTNAMHDGDEITAVVYTIPLQMEDYLNAVKTSTGAHRQFDGDFCLGFMTASATIRTTSTYRVADIPDWK